MQNELSKCRKVLFTALVLACFFGVLNTLFNAGYSIYILTDYYKYKWLVFETLGYKIYHSEILKILMKVFFYTGFASVYALWKKPRPIWKFVLIVAAGFLPSIVSKTINQLIIFDSNAWNHILEYNIFFVLFSCVGNCKVYCNCKTLC